MEEGFEKFVHDPGIPQGNRDKMGSFMDVLHSCSLGKQRSLTGDSGFGILEKRAFLSGKNPATLANVRRSFYGTRFRCADIQNTRFGMRCFTDRPRFFSQVDTAQADRV
ncbi:MAG: hypothetical protein HQL95_09650 [Magnetococcales bacterium]|nr:hypothetical protein [Magnetococcales bacterium]